MNKKVFIIILSACYLVGCASVGNFKTDDIVKKYPATQASKIDVYSADITDRQYEVLGKVIASADAGSNSKIAVDFLKKEAALFGADAVINLRLGISYGFWTSGITAKGTAIKYIKN